MKAAVVTGRRRFEIREIPTPQAQPGTVLIKVKLCAICGTDLEFVDNPRLDEKKRTARRSSRPCWDTSGWVKWLS